ncbi:MAG: hypothetical protein KAJ59_06165 [Thermodesulfovibrionia bacterium]|nr:hypothetical protein [Thermodesulfovibrionia bacterium]
MKKLVLVGLTVISLIAFGALTYAHGPGGWGGGNMMGQGYGAHMMGPGGGHMMGWSGSGYGYDQKFLEETREQRKELHDKKFSYFEALRDPTTTPETKTKLEKEIQELQEAISEKAPRTAYGKFGGYGCRW